MAKYLIKKILKKFLFKILSDNSDKIINFA